MAGYEACSVTDMLPVVAESGCATAAFLDSTTSVDWRHATPAVARAAVKNAYRLASAFAFSDTSTSMMSLGLLAHGAEQVDAATGAYRSLRVNQNASENPLCTLASAIVHS